MTKARYAYPKPLSPTPRQTILRQSCELPRGFYYFTEA